MRRPRALRDPWVAGGVALLAALTVGMVLLYRSGPQSVAEARGRTWVAVAPDAFTPRVSRAEERLRAAGAALQAGDTAAAVQGYAAAAEAAWEARERAPGAEEAARATEIWAGALLERAEVMLRSATAPWWRRDDEPLLREALSSVERVLSVRTSAASRQRAEALAGEIHRKLRPGPLEWLPPRG